MDSPETAKTTTTTATSASSDLVPVQDSPIFSYISNLSPLQPLNAVLVAQGFPGLNSPPLVFRSPQINPNLEASFLKGPRFPLLPSVEIPQNDDKGEKIEVDLEIHERAVNRSSNELIKCAEKRCDTKASVQAQPCSSSGCLVECYTVSHGDSAKSGHSTDSSLKQANAVSQLSKDGCFESTEDFVKLNDDEHSKKKLNMRVGASPALEEQSEDESQGKSASHAKLVENEGKKNCNEKPFINVVYGHASKEQKSEHIVDGHASKEQKSEHIVAQYTGGHHKEENDCGHQLLLESFNMVEGREVCGENAELISIGSLSNMVVHDPEASQHKSGIRRRCLFEEAHPNIIADSPCSSNLSNSSKSPATLSNIENTESSLVDATPTSNNRQVVGLHHPEKILYPSCTAGNSSRTVSKPSGIGLHLNSIVSALPLGCGAIARFSAGDKDQLNIQGLKSASQINCQLPENIKSGSISSNIVDNYSACSEDGMHENKGLIAASTAACDSAYGGKNSPSSSMLKPTEDCATPHNKRKIYTEHADNYEDLNQPSPKKKRKKASSTIGGEGCKRCNCRKTKCLKLYCDCFAAGIYCSELCACQGCFNKPEYEDTVFETRQQIESRNPLAFAPKVVQPVSESPAENAERAIQLGLSSARHKRGCNCKRSMCLKKYCECYQGNVGCSDGCRCEGCKNVYGRKEEYVLVKELVNQRASDESLEGTSDDKLDMAATKKDFSCTEIYNLHDLTPLTPSVQYSDIGKEASRTRLLSRRCCPSPESDFTVLSSFGKSPRSPTDSERHDIVLNTSKEILDVASYDRELFYSSLERRVQSSPSYDGLASIHSGTPLPDASSIATASSASKTRDWTNGSGVQLCPGSSRLSSSGSLRWRSSPITPMTRLGETKALQGFDSDSGLYGIAGDGTPDILKESTPFKAFKVNSPNRKRVSPPKHTRLHELGSSSSGGLKSGRKFILQAVPSFPSLSPCIETKGRLHQNESDIQDSGNK